jgi:hypothetical protein
MTVGTKRTTVILDGDDEIADTSGNSNPKPNLLTVRGAGGEPVASIKVSTGVKQFYHLDGPWDADDAYVRLTTKPCAAISKQSRLRVPATNEAKPACRRICGLFVLCAFICAFGGSRRRRGTRTFIPTSCASPYPPRAYLSVTFLGVPRPVQRSWPFLIQ